MKSQLIATVVALTSATLPVFAQNAPRTAQTTPGEVRSVGGDIGKDTPEFWASMNHAEALVKTGNVFLEHHNFAAAEIQFREVVALNLIPIEAHLGLAESLVGENRIAEANTAYHAAFYNKSHTSSITDDPIVRVRYISFLLSTQQWREAVAVYQITVTSPETIKYNNLGESTPAVNIPFDPDVLQPSRMMAVIHLFTGMQDSRTGEQKKALHEFTEAVKLQPNLGFAQFYYGYGLKMVGRKAEAQAAFQNAQKVGTGTVKTAAAQQLSELNR